MSRPYLQLGFDVARGEVASVRCHGAMLWPRFIASFLVPSLGIALIPG